MKVIALILLTTLLVGCTTTELQPDDISVYEDEESGVTCYILNGLTKSISCIPNSQLVKSNIVE